jgi:hypothetical protein
MPALECGDLPALTAEDHQRLADQLRAAARERHRVEPLSARHPELNVADARRIRDIVLADRLEAGERLAGAVASPGRAGESRLAWVTDDAACRAAPRRGTLARGAFLRPSAVTAD